jgi:hypothetical protein
MALITLAPILHSQFVRVDFNRETGVAASHHGPYRSDNAVGQMMRASQTWAGSLNLLVWPAINVQSGDFNAVSG